VDVPEEIGFSWGSMVQKPFDIRPEGLDNRGESLISGAPRQPRLVRKPWVSGAIERAGASILPLPPYRPDFNPIEEMFSKFKGFLRRVGARAKEHLYDAIGEGLREVTPEDILGWFRHAGQCVMQA
jgi:hypothetical protein